MPGTVVGVASERDLLVARQRPRQPTCALFAERRVPGKQLCSTARRGDLARTCTTSAAERGCRRDSADARLVDGLAALSAIGAGINATRTSWPVRRRWPASASPGCVPRHRSAPWLVPDERVKEAVRACTSATSSATAAVL
jgi:hypothetical protein